MRPACTIGDCDRPTVGRGLCGRHYQRWWSHGDPHFLAKRPNGAVLEELAEAASPATDECIILRSGRVESVKFNGKKMNASRVVWSIANGDPGDLQVLHRCNGGSGAHGCVNIRHLYLGTAADNSQDRIDAGRSGRGESRTRGEINGRAKLSVADVVQIRRVYQRGDGPRLAAQYGVAVSTINRAARGDMWASVND